MQRKLPTPLALTITAIPMVGIILVPPYLFATDAASLENWVQALGLIACLIATMFVSRGCW
jgi:hypothetical protein